MTSTAELAATRGSASPGNRTRPVAVLMSRFPAITETFILREMIEMERQGQTVRLVPMLKDSPPVLHEAAKPWVPRALFTWYVSPAIVAANLRTLVRRPLKYVSLLARLIAGTILSPKMFVRTVAVFPKSIYLAEQLQKEGLRHLHAHYATHPSTMTLIISELTDITFSFTVHAHDIQLDQSLLRWKMRETRFVRSISDFNKRFLEKLYPEESRGKISVIHVGIEPEMYETTGARITPEPNAIPRLLCVAAHRPYKGIAYLIEACRILRDQGVRFQCDVVGQGPDTALLQAMVDEKGVGDVFRLVGPRAQEEVTKMMAEATLFVLASIVAPDGQMEGIPVALMEAMATGRAVVSTSISGIPELVENGVHGLLVPHSDSIALAEAIKSLLNDPQRAREMGIRGQQKIRAEFVLSDCVRRLLELIDRENAA